MAKVRAKRESTQDKLMGKEVLLYINFGDGATEAEPKWCLVGGQTSANLDMSADSIDATNKTSGGWGESYAGLKSTELSLEAVICKSDDGYSALKDAFIRGEAVDVARYAADGTADRNWYSITEISDNTPHDDTATFTATLKGLGAPTFYKGARTVDDIKGSMKPADTVTVVPTSSGTGV